MKLKEIFAKPVDRPIEGVIKADDLTRLKTEVEEYVITNEISKSLSQFFDAYNDYQGANGVWISGFFGSGKSHLLKMLALLMENQVVDGKPALEYFLPKCADDAMLQGAMRKAVSIPSKSILFNIDQKADTISKSEVDALLSVFVKVFNEMCGYFGKHGYIAQFERDLEKRGLYEDFKKTFERLTNRRWETGREQAILEKNNIARAYAMVAGEPEASTKNIVDAYRQDYKMSIEDFAEMVNDYIQAQDPNFRLNFFVDEVGQYIADNLKLMTNLQTIAESLATKCGGRSWIVVTAQEDMNTVLGEMNKQQTNDFSKIQARFNTRMKLTSQNVDEVIQRRLLQKNARGEAYLGELYDKEKNNFGTLFDFSDGARTYRNFRDKQHFVNSYPFIPYQFTLFQTAIQNLSVHNAFEGKHSSVGERSMLGVFQEVAVRISDKAIGELAPFDLMFEGIRSVLKAQIQSSILTSEKHMDNPFAKRLLKALFLVKYIRDFKATPRNLRVLLQDSFDRDLPELRKKIEGALDLLEQQSYIQRNGDVYEYLTDEEKDIEMEIKNTEIDTGDIAKTLEDILFTDIIGDRKIRYGNTKQDYPFTKKLDDRVLGRESELAIHFITPFNENVDKIKILQANSLGKPELMIVLPQDDRLFKDIQLFKKTEKYIKLSQSTTRTETVRNILSAKAAQNAKRLREIKDALKALIGKARFFIQGEEIQLGEEEAKTRIIHGFNELIAKVYPNLRMLGDRPFSEKDIRDYLSLRQESLFQDDLAGLSEPEHEIFSYIQRNRHEAVKTTLKNLVDHFSKRPYGWYLAAIQCNLALLMGRGKVEARVDSNLLDDIESQERVLKNTHAFGNVILEPRAEFTPSQVRHLKDFFNDFFDRPAGGSEARALALEIRRNFEELKNEMERLEIQSAHYPFLASLKGPLELIKTLAEKTDYTYFIEKLPGVENDLMAMKENTLDPVRRFMAGTGKTIYDELREFIDKQAPNFPSLEGDAPERLRAFLNDPACYRGNKMGEAKDLMEGLKNEIERRVKEEREQTGARIEQLRKRLEESEDYEKLNGQQRENLAQKFAAALEEIDRQTLIPVIRDRAQRFETKDYNDILGQISNWLQKGSGGTQPPVAYVPVKSLNVDFDKPYLATEEDVKAYLKVLGKAMIKALAEKKRITL